MPISWKVRELLSKDISNYRFWKDSGLSRQVAYGIMNNDRDSMDMRTIDKLIPYLRTATGDKSVQIGDVVEYVE